jgi:integrase
MLSENFGAKTDPIPDDELQRLLIEAVRFVDENGIQTIQEFRKFIAEEKIFEIYTELKSLGNDDLTRRRLAKVKERLEILLKDRTWDRQLTLSVGSLSSKINATLGDCAYCLEQDRKLGQAFRDRRYRRGCNYDWDLSDLNFRIRLVQVACFVIIATSTGMRQSELLTLKPGCLVERKVRGKRLYWLKSILSKTSPSRAGEPSSWLCGELAANAIGILEQLHAVMPSIEHTSFRSHIPLPDSLFRTYTWNSVVFVARPMVGWGRLRSALHAFAKELGLTIGRIHPHRFRRSFARNIVRWTETPVAALQRHFKHWSMLMTDYYIGTDPQLMEMFFEAQMEASKDRLRQILSGECGGPGGLFLQKRLAKMADLGELPKNFLGVKSDKSIEAVVKEASRDGILAYKCADFTTCLYVPGTAKCGEDGPKEHDCHPTECLNSHILIEDVPFYLRNITQNERVFDELPPSEQAGPFGIFVSKRIRNDVVAIQPLVSLYNRRLEGLRTRGDTPYSFHTTEEIAVLQRISNGWLGKRQTKYQ